MVLATVVICLKAACQPVMMWSSIYYGVALQFASGLVLTRPGSLATEMLSSDFDSDHFEEVIQDAIAGRSGALDQLFVQFKALVLYFVSCLRCGHAEDVASDVWQRVTEKIGTLENRGVPAFCGWLRQIAGHLAADHAKACDAANPLQILEQPASPINLAEQLLLRELIWRFTERLSPLHRSVYEMRFVEGFSNDEIANRMGLDVKYVAVIVFRIRKRFLAFFRGGQEKAEGQ